MAGEAETGFSVPEHSPGVSGRAQCSRPGKDGVSWTGTRLIEQHLMENSDLRLSGL